MPFYPADNNEMACFLSTGDYRVHCFRKTRGKFARCATDSGKTLIYKRNMFQMKKYYSYSAGLFILIIALSFTSLKNNKKVIHFLSTNGELTSTIKIPDYN